MERNGFEPFAGRIPESNSGTDPRPSNGGRLDCGHLEIRCPIAIYYDIVIL